jgi:hypothetical protein
MRNGWQKNGLRKDCWSELFMVTRVTQSARSTALGQNMCADSGHGHGKASNRRKVREALLVAVAAAVLALVPSVQSLGRLVDVGSAAPASQTADQAAGVQSGADAVVAREVSSLLSAG